MSCKNVNNLAEGLAEFSTGSDAPALRALARGDSSTGCTLLRLPDGLTLELREDSLGRGAMCSLWTSDLCFLQGCGVKAVPGPSRQNTGDLQCPGPHLAD